MVSSQVYVVRFNYKTVKEEIRAMADETEDEPVDIKVDNPMEVKR